MCPCHSTSSDPSVNPASARPVRKPKRGEVFIHARFLKEDARPPYTDDSYAEHVVTSVFEYADSVTVNHTSAENWNAGRRRASWSFNLAREEHSVRQWL